jgi:DnaJ domain
MMNPETYYDILGVSEGANDEAVKHAFRDLAKHYHPDRNPNDDDAERQFKRINTAYEGLKDASRREAYNQWLEFAQKRTRVKRTQWGRLAALVFLLLIGPSAVLYWAVVIADIPMFAGGGDKIEALNPPREAGLPPPKPERRQPFSQDETAEQRPPADTASETAAQPANSPPPAEPLSDASTSPPPARAAQERQQADSPVAASRPEPDAKPNVAGSDQGPRTATGSPSPPAEDDGSIAEKAYTQALPDEPSPPVPQSRWDAGGLSEAPGQAAGNFGSSEAADANPDQSDREDAAQGARATARMLARLKEPQGAQSDDALPSDNAASARENAAPPARENAYPPPWGDGPDPDGFTDCDECPLISMAGSNEMFGGNSRAAVSLTEITLADWDGCVADRACPPYDRPQRGSRRETTIEVGLREAEAYANWLSAISGKSYRVVMSPRRREAAGQRCNGAGRNGSNWEWLDDNAERNCPPQSASEQSPDGARGFRVFRRSLP